MGGIYAREDGRPEEVWKAIYFHYLPVGVEATAPPTQRPTGQGGDHVGRGLAGRQARYGHQHVCRRRAADRIARSVRAASRRAGHRAHPRRSAGTDGPRSAADARRPRDGRQADEAFWSFMADRVRFVLEQRGYDTRNVRAVTHSEITRAIAARREAQAGGAAGVHGVRRSSSSSRCCSSACGTSRRTSMQTHRTLAAR